MPSRKKIVLAFIVVLAFLGWLALPHWLEWQMRRIMAQQGFTIASIGKIHAGVDGAEFVDIKLDKDGFSTIDSLYVRGLLPPYGIIIKDLAMTGDITPAGTPEIDGWTLKPMNYPGSVKSLLLEHAALDLMTSDGSIRIEAKGQMQPGPKNSRHIDAMLFANQQQLSLDSHWTIDWTHKGAWKAAGEIGNLRLHLGAFDATRASGWLNLASAAPAAPLNIAGQLAAGMLSMNPVILQDVSLTVNGPYASLDFILQGFPQHQKDVRVYGSVKQNNGQLDVNTRITAPTLAGLTALLQNMHAAFAGNHSLADAMTGLLLTQGNLNRIKASLSGFPYEALTLTLSGPVYGLSGKITATHVDHGVKREKVVGFDPAAHQ